MKKILVISLFILVCSSCIKKEQKQNDESQIVGLLNQNKSDEALDKINDALKTNNSDDMLYLKASALSMKAGVDIYSLFPLLKVKIFEVAIAQWSENREFQKKADAKKVSIGLDVEDLEKEKSDLKKQYVPIQLDAIKYQSSISLGQRYSRDNPSCVLYIQAAKNLFDYKNSRVYLNHRLYSETQCEEASAHNNQSFELSPEDSYFNEVDLIIKQTLADEHKLRWEERSKEVKKKNNYIKALGTFWTLIDMVPMVKKMPKLTTEGFLALEEAQEILLKIRANRNNSKDEMDAKARKQLMMISALKIVGRIQNSFNLENVKTPVDFICESNDQAAEELVASTRDAYLIINTIDDPEIIKKNKAMFDEIREKYATFESDLEDSYRREKNVKELADSLIENKKRNCEGDGLLNELL